MPNISFKTLEVWNIERAGNIKSIELIAIFNVENIENKLVWALFDSKNNVISSLTVARKYLKGEAVYPKFFESETPDGIVTMTAYLLDGNNKQISNIASKTLYLKKAQPASGIGQRALQDPTFTLPVFPEATTTATTTAQSAELISVKVQRDIQDVYVSPEQARATEKVTVSAPFGVSFLFFIGILYSIMHTCQGFFLFILCHRHVTMSGGFRVEGTPVPGPKSFVHTCV